MDTHGSPQIPTDLPMAEFSDDGAGADGKGSYRFTLWRKNIQTPDLICDRGDDFPKMRIFQYVQFIGLNPSTATETKDDPTIRRCIGFARKWGFDALLMTNVFAWRDTKPENMKKAPEPTGDPRNMMRLTSLAQGAGMIVAAWGSHGKFRYRDREIRDALRPFAEKVFCLRLSMQGLPEHPLYMPNDIELIPLPMESPCDRISTRKSGEKLE